MKKIYGLIAVVVAILAFAFYRASMPKPSANNNVKKVAGPKTVKVGILQLVTHPALDQIHRGVVAGLRSQGYHVGKNLKIDYQNAQADQANLQTMASKFANENEDLMVGIATPAAQSLAKAAAGKTPVILAGITDPVGGGLIKSNQRPGANITGTSGESPLKSHLNLIKQIVPKAKTLGIIYTTSDHGGTYNALKMQKFAQQAGYTVKMYTISTTNDMQTIAGQMVSQVDAVYAPQDNGVASAMKTLVNVANAAKVPVFPAADTMVHDGGLATLAVSQFQLGKVSGIMAANVLKGRKPANYPIEFIRKGIMSVNTTEAKLLGITLPASVLKQAKDKGEIFK
ncbi:tryptophan ABC transporter substrate-binding protein [Oenococcus sp.]|uniref:tryptophan ABC transporter substrate-binding protein n=1 Tax=Oenococcus sp. TaxID=1979414 RepID=UPI0039E96F1F